MGAQVVVFPKPVLEDDTCLRERVEHLAVKTLVLQTRVEGLDKSVLPRAAWIDVNRFEGRGQKQYGGSEYIDEVFLHRTTTLESTMPALCSLLQFAD